MIPNGITLGSKMMPMRNKKPQMPEQFWKWLNAQLDGRGWSDRELADNAGIANSVISKARSGIQPIGYDACKAIAKALNVKDVFVLCLAGLIEKEADANDKREQLTSYFDQLPSDDQDDLLANALGKLLRRKQKEKPDGKLARKAGTG